MRVKVWSGILIVGLLLTAGCSNHHTEYGPSDNAMVANQVQPAGQVQANNNLQPSDQVSPVSVPFLAIAGMSPGLVKPMEEPVPQQPSIMPTMMAEQPLVNSPVVVAGNNLEPLPVQETSPAPNMNVSNLTDAPVTMTKIDRSANPVGNIMNNTVPVPNNQPMAYPAGGMFMYQAGQGAPANMMPQRMLPPQNNQVMTAQTSSNAYVDAVLKQAANYKRVYSVTSGEYFDPKTKQVFQTIQ